MLHVAIAKAHVLEAVRLILQTMWETKQWLRLWRGSASLQVSSFLIPFLIVWRILIRLLGFPPTWFEFGIGVSLGHPVSWQSSYDAVCHCPLSQVSGGDGRRPPDWLQRSTMDTLLLYGVWDAVADEVINEFSKLVQIVQVCDETVSIDSIVRIHPINSCTGNIPSAIIICNGLK